MFGYDDLEAYEDDLYREMSSSETEIDSEVEFQLYSQVHYANNIIEMKKDGKGDTAPILLATTSVKQMIFSGSNVEAFSDDSVILLDSENDDSVYTCKDAKSSECYRKQRNNRSIGESAPESETGANHSRPRVNRLAEMKKLYQWMRRKCPKIQETRVMRESGSSGSEDDDEMENWMVLENDEEKPDDDNIQLNIVGCEALEKKGGYLCSEWFICEKDLQKRFVGYQNRYYIPRNQNLDCRNCGKKGHLSRNCQAPKKFPTCHLCGVRGHLQRCCPKKYCTNCSMPGHLFNKCTEKAYWKIKCCRCYMSGHHADACPEIWRQYHLTTSQGPIVSESFRHAAKRSIYCYNCGKQGHYGHECIRKSMNKYIFPASPLVHHYDTEQDIKKREQRIQRKMKELQDPRLLETSFQTKKRCREFASKDLRSKKAKKKQKRELLKKRYKEQGQGEITRKNWMTKNKTNSHHRPSHFLKRFNERAEEDFPREFASTSKSTNVFHHRNHQSLLFVHGNPPQAQMKKRGSKKRKKKNDMEATKDQIKKRKKKFMKTKVSVIEGTASPFQNNDLIIKQKKKHKKFLN
ncbi:zinc finger CCHC domain-containing protein 7 isoform X2 [Narcine bancroftii]|uniref:zinc finger CCHC domain-containing protein 7 isoform X2 n=1 Tax=Narcine bancroftii TaxID=1343680 RepID=UPI003832111D